MGHLAKYCQLYIRVLHCVLLLYISAIGKPAGLRPVRGFPALHGQDVTPADYYASSVARLIFRLFSHSHFWPSDWGNPRLAIHPVALDLGGPFRSFIPYWACVSWADIERPGLQRSIQERVGITILPTRYDLPRLTLGFRQSSFHHIEIALGNTPV
jgi:hypothetical protein